MKTEPIYADANGLTVDHEYGDGDVFPALAPGRRYRVCRRPHGFPGVRTSRDTLDVLMFQRGPISSAGVNGVTNEALIAILIHRIGILDADLHCPENTEAMLHLRAAALALEQRAARRKAAGVEGTMTEALEPEPVRTPFQAVAAGLGELDSLIAQGKGDGPEADALRDEMDASWNALTEGQRDEFRDNVSDQIIDKILSEDRNSDAADWEARHPDVSAEIRRRLASGDNIGAIHYARDVLRVGLRDAKLLVEEVVAAMYPPTTQGGGDVGPISPPDGLWNLRTIDDDLEWVMHPKYPNPITHDEVSEAYKELGGTDPFLTAFSVRGSNGADLFVEVKGMTPEIAEEAYALCRLRRCKESLRLVMEKCGVRLDTALYITRRFKRTAEEVRAELLRPIETKDA